MNTLARPPMMTTHPSPLQNFQPNYVPKTPNGNNPFETSDREQQIQQLNATFAKLQEDAQKLKSKREATLNHLQNPQNFASSIQIADLQAFTIANTSKYEELVDELAKFKELLEIETHAKVELTKKYEEMKGQLANFATEMTATDKSNLILHLKNLQITVDKLSKEVDENTQKNSRYLEQMNKKDFFKEYEKNCKEVDTLRKQNLSLNEELKRLRREAESEPNYSSNSMNNLTQGGIPSKQHQAYAQY